MPTNRTPLYVLTYGNQDGETITRGPVSAIEALEIADDLVGHIPAWSGVSFFAAGDYDGEIDITREFLEESTRAPAPQLIHNFQTETYGTRVCLSDSDYEELYPGRSADDIQIGTPVEWFGAILRYTGSHYSTRTN